MKADLVERRGVFRVTYCVTDTVAREPMRFAEGAQSDNALVVRGEAGELARRDKVGVCFVKKQQAVGGNLLAERLDLCPRVEEAAGVVGIG